MSNDDKGSKTEEATSKRREDSFKEGTFAKAPEIGVVFVLGSAFVVILFNTKNTANKLGLIAAELFSQVGSIQLTQESASKLLIDKLQDLFLLTLPIFAAAFIAAFAAGALQSGLQLTPKVMEPKFSKLNPVKGLQNIFSVKSYVRGLIDVAKFIAVAIVIYAALKEITQHDIFSSPIAIPYIGEFIYQTALTMLARLILILGLIAAIHYIYQRYKTSKDLMMSKQEVKDEHKEQEGSPFVKSAQRSMARRLMQKQMLQDVPIADVIVTNPTHFAVALKYEIGKDPAPVVLAKGQDMFAKRIKEIAAKHEVPMVENVSVARLVYKIGKVGEPIPSNLYQVIAEILSTVYKSNKYYFHKLKSRRKEHEKRLKDK